jgi:hypothetical protein
LIDANNNIIAQEFDNLTYYKNGIAFYGIKSRSGTKWGIIDLNGKKITDTILNNVVINSDLYYGASIIDEHGKEKWGFIDKTGKFIIKPSFDSARIFYDKYGTVAMKEGSALKLGIINRDGNDIIKCKYNVIYPFNS